MKPYDLTREPWIDVMLADGSHTTYGIHDALAHADRIRRLDLDGAPEELSVLRLLAAILIRANVVAGTADTMHWEAQWAANAIDMTPVGRYLEQWHDRFDLHDPRHPFMQSPGLDCRTRPVGELRFASPWIDGPSREQLTSDQAAMRLLTFLDYDVGGIKPAASGDVRASKNKLMPPSGLMAMGTLGRIQAMWCEYDTLAHTLLALAPVIAPDGTPNTSMDDLPAWEREPLHEEILDDRPTGIVDQLTMLTRRILLDADGQGNVTGFHATYGRIAGRTLPKGAEPLCPYDRKGLPMPTVGDMITNPMWRHLAGITGPLGRPDCLEWACRLAGDTTRMTLHWMGCTYLQGARPEACEHRTLAGIPTGIIHDETRVALLRRTEAALGAYLRFMRDITPRWDDDIAARCQELTALDLAGDMDQLLQNPVDDPFSVIRCRFTEMADEESLRYPMRAAEPYLILLGALKRITEEDIGPVSRHSPGRQGRPATPIIRHGGGLDDQRFDTVNQALEWLHANGRPKANKAGLYKALREHRPAYGFQWTKTGDGKEDQ